MITHICGRAVAGDENLFPFTPWVTTARAMSNIGTATGQFIYYEDGLLEILDQNEVQHHLLAAGWVDKIKCRLTD